MTRDEFLKHHAPLAKNPDTGRLRYEPDFTRDLDALLAAARAEALREAADPMEAEGLGLEHGEVRRALSRHVRRIRALVKP